jgi:hypothetical protein
VKSWLQAFDLLSHSICTAYTTGGGTPDTRKYAATALWEMREHRELIPDILAADGVKHLAALCTASGKTAPPVETLSAAVGVLWFLSMDEGAARAIAKSGVMPSLMSHMSSKSAAVVGRL